MAAAGGKIAVATTWTMESGQEKEAMKRLELTTGLNGFATWTAIYRDRVELYLSPAARTAITKAHEVVQRVVAQGGAVYGINTGFGRLAGSVIADDAMAALQKNVVVTHAIGSGPALSIAETRLVMAMKIASLAQGHSGIRPALVEFLIGMFNCDLLPVIPSQGSVGASGDLTPLAHLAAAMIGEGTVTFGGEIVPAAEALASAGLEPLSLQPKEGLAMLNGTQVSTALALAGTLEARQAFDTAVIVGALTTEGLLGSVGPFDDRLHRIRRQPGQIEVARRLRALTRGSEFRDKDLAHGRVQDPYCLRCQPQVYGACLDLLNNVEATLELEADAVTDNPIVFPETGEIISGGNFHAEPVAFAADNIALAVCELGALSERRLAMMTDSSLSGLPPFLTDDPGVNSGFMSGQIAAAAMVAENRQKAHPASVDSVPTVVNYEDHVSMATHGARRLSAMLETLNNILATELLAAAEACDHQGLELSSPLAEVKALVRKHVARMNSDRAFGPAYEAAREMVKSGKVAALCRGI
ncbi:histidine ammonia-lyase [Denitrobaculum tricleocarpae]|uniref:Histidine ammonia-lyase n=2 Tax=Denitrobaculum tricleocarpae TaxID=2591009 RepID=A0A545SSZ7_9PROT|nr:histidine ammonia-lyase [Denitrobaculum tricleocarpae]TQV68077.1 histidine ammonia-lyase [Denitrobaculum tricleocarpae]